MIPLLAAAPCLMDNSDAAVGRSRVPAGISLWQTQQPPARVLDNPNPILAPSSFSYLGKPMPTALFDSATAPAGIIGGSGGSLGGLIGGAHAGGGIGGVGALSFPTCQDCGNQAKKDCSHRRCRTCCKSRGFDCATHVKSTWMPAARRRERQMSGAAALDPGGGGAAAASSASTSAAKKPRLIAASDGPPAATATATATTTSRTSTSNTATPPRSFETTSSHQDAAFRESLPGQLRAPAVFKCVRVTTVEDGEDEFAYQAMVRIGGHVFKGFLYDQGVEAAAGITITGGQDDHGGDDNRNSGSCSMPNISDLHLGGAAVGDGGPSDVYAAAGAGGGFLGGTSYVNTLNR